MSIAPGREQVVAGIMTRTGIDEAMIARLVRAFYGRARSDPVIGPVFESKVEDWDEHIEKLCAFWSSVALMSGRYHGQPMVAHLPLPIEGPHFRRWLELFTETAREICPPRAAAHFLERARRIAESLQLGIAVQRGKLPARRDSEATIPDEKPEFSSPACSMHEADDLYMGFATKPEVIDFLTALLRSERIIAASKYDQAFRHDAGRWCVALSQALTKLGAALPNEQVTSPVVDDMAGLIHRLRAMLPRVRDDGLYALLSDILRGHDGKFASAATASPRQWKRS